MKSCVTKAARPGAGHGCYSRTEKQLRAFKLPSTRVDEDVAAIDLIAFLT